MRAATAGSEILSFDSHAQERNKFRDEERKTRNIERRKLNLKEKAVDD